MIIGVGHKLRHGKDTVATMINEMYPEFIIEKFAGGIYDQVQYPRKSLFIFKPLEKVVMVYNADSDEYDTMHVNECEKILPSLVINGRFSSSIRGNSFCPRFTYDKMNYKDRDILQWWGTEYRREKYGDDYWIRDLENRIDPNRNYVISDLRFKNEFDYIKSTGGITVKVDRGMLFEKDKSTHHSEVDLDDREFDEVIYNTGTLDQLRDMVCSLMKEVYVNP